MFCGWTIFYFLLYYGKSATNSMRSLVEGGFLHPIAIKNEMDISHILLLIDGSVFVWIYGTWLMFIDNEIDIFRLHLSFLGVSLPRPL